MLQSFAILASPEQGPPRLALLRAELARAGLDGFMVPRADAHQGEYVAPCDERLAWLTGFTGSAGFAIVTATRAGVFVDGRYRLQVRDQTDPDHFTPVDWPETKPGPWLRDALPDGGRIGFDPSLHTVAEIDKLEQALDGADIALVPVANPIDAIWQDRPAPPQGRVVCQTPERAGPNRAEKLAAIAGVLDAAGHDAAVLTLPDSLSWLLNIRGADIARVPVVQSFGILHRDGTLDFFVDPAKLDGSDLALGDAVRPAPPSAFAAALGGLTGRVRVDRDTAPQAVLDQLRRGAAEVVFDSDPCILPKARKNAVELTGAAEAHRRDGAAMVNFLAWLDAQAPEDLTEIDVITALEGFRKETGMLRDIAFDTIAGSGPNAAIVHYRVTEATNRPLARGEMLLIDSGGQYLDGTTDITRTIALGRTQPQHRAAFTRVLRGMIAISRLRFPRGLAGRDLDAFARAPLWAVGQDYDHGTGHGVGHYLSVHEGPQRLSRHSHVVLEPGMILSNEPGYYRPGAFGIRIENLIVVETAAALQGADDRPMLSFRTLTLAPIDLRLIDAGALDTGERDWLNRYHARVRAEIGPRVSGDTRRWLKAATAPI